MIEQIVEPREVTLVGDLKVKRILPFRSRRSVGPFVFLDEMGPLACQPGKAGDVPPHPHIGLSTVTYLFEGELLHRDTLGSVQAIRPSDVNWMTAGRGIAHSERIRPELREHQATLHGLQAWVALPSEQEESVPSFDHYCREALPKFKQGDVDIHLIAGSVFGKTSPVKTHSPLFYFCADFDEKSVLNFNPGGQECAFYLVSGRVNVGGQVFKAPVFLVFTPGAEILVEAASEALGVFLGGAPLESPRFIWWNFVSSSKERIEKAKSDWREGRFGQIPGETEFVPLPGEAQPSEKLTLP